MLWRRGRHGPYSQCFEINPKLQAQCVYLSAAASVKQLSTNEAVFKDFCRGRSSQSTFWKVSRSSPSSQICVLSQFVCLPLLKQVRFLLIIM